MNLRGLPYNKLFTFIIGYGTLSTVDEPAIGLNDFLDKSDKGFFSLQFLGSNFITAKIILGVFIEIFVGLLNPGLGRLMGGLISRLVDKLP